MGKTKSKVKKKKRKKIQKSIDLIPKWKPDLELQARINQANGISSLW